MGLIEVKMPIDEREQLVLEHMPQVKFIAKHIHTKLPPQVELDDLVNSGVLGLLSAADKYDSSRGTQFKTYAEFRIRGAILDGLRGLDWASRKLRKKVKGKERTQKALEQRYGRPATDKELCEEMNISTKELHELDNQIHGLSQCSFEELFNEEDGKNSESLIIDTVSAAHSNPFVVLEEKEQRNLLAVAIDTLPLNQRLAVSLYYNDFKDRTMKEIGEMIGVGESAVSQLLTRAMKRLKKWMRGRLVALPQVIAQRQKHKIGAKTQSETGISFLNRTITKLEREIANDKQDLDILKRASAICRKLST